MFHISRKTDDVRLLYVCENKDPTRRTHIQLGLISENGNNQFILIKDMSKFFLSLKQRRRYFCERCLSVHKTPKNLRSHEEKCGKNKPCKMLELGGKNHFITFKS